MSTTTETAQNEHVEAHHELPLNQAVITLAVITIIELIIANFDGGWVTAILLALTVAKALIVGAVFMEIAYDKDTKNIILYVFIVPLIAVLFLIFAIIADWR